MNVAALSVRPTQDARALDVVRQEPVAIIGMAVMLPGAGDLPGYRHNLVHGVDAITDVPEHRWDSSFYRPANGLPVPPDVVYCRRGGFVDQFAHVDATRFGIPPLAVPGTEPDQLIALHVAAAAVDDAGGLERLPDRDRVGVVLGKGGYVAPAGLRFNQRVRGVHQLTKTLGELLPHLDDEELELVRRAYAESLGHFRPETAIGLVSNLSASRIANRLDLRGPAYTVDGACASSLLAVDQAVQALAAGRCDVVLAGGVHHSHDVSFWSVFAQLRALSSSEVIRPFDGRADGTLIGEGTGVVVLKRLPDAQRDGDRVYAIVRGVGVSSDGRGTSLFNPDSNGQIRAVMSAWRAAGIDSTAPGSIGMLEAHGTATPAGDAAELNTIASVFGPRTDGPIPVLGTVKSMIGHTMPAAGVAGLVKAALARYHGVQLPTLHCEQPHPLVARTRFRTIPAAQPWEPGPTGVRRAGVSAFGFGGINAHMVLEQAADPVDLPAPPIPVQRSQRAVALDLASALVPLAPMAVAKLRTLIASPSSSPPGSAGDLVSVRRPGAGGSTRSSGAGLPASSRAVGLAVVPESDGDGGWRARLTISTRELPYLLDHCFFRQRRDWPDEADRWPVMPATTMVRLVLDLAQKAAPDKHAVRVSEVRFHQWLSAAPATDVVVTGRPAGDDRLVVKLGEFAQMTVELAPRYPRAPQPWHADSAEEPIARPAATLYTDRLMFHGPRFQGVVELIGASDHHIRGLLEAPDAPGALLDNCGQLLGYWVISHYTERTRVLPVGMDLLTLFGPTPAAGARLGCTVRISSVDASWVVADVQLMAEGRVWAEIRGWRDRRFDNDPTTQRSETFPEIHTLSQHDPAGWVALHERWDDLATRLLVLRNQLGTPERDRYEAVPPRERRQWLLRRIAAKDAVRQWLWEQGEGPIFPAEIELLEQDGRLVARGRHGRQVPPLDIEVAVTAGTAVAAVRPSGSSSPPGIAIVPVADAEDCSAQDSCRPIALPDDLVDEAARRAAAVAHREGLDAVQVTASDGSLRAVVVSGRGRHRVRHVRTAVLPVPEGLGTGPWLVAWT